MKNKRVLFITPPYHCGVVEVAGRWAPLTFAYLAGHIRQAGFEPVIYDAMTKQHGFREIERTIEEIGPFCVATTAITSTVNDALRILEIAKAIDRRIVTIIGGVHPTFMYKEVLSNRAVDFVVRGEGEETLRELLLCLQTGSNYDRVKGIAYRKESRVVTTETRPFIRDLDSLSPAWDLIDWKDYRYFVIPRSRLGAVSTSRGCSHNCTFCSQQKFWHQTWRARRPEEVVREIEYLKSRYGVNVFLFTDEYPTLDPMRWERLLDLLIERDLGVYILMETRAEDIIRDREILYKYRKAGIVHVYIGVESTEQETLDLIKKDIKVETGMEALRLIHEHGMISETSFILGFPEETRESIKRTLKLSRLYNPDFAHYLSLAPWPYADMYEELRPYIAETDYSKYNLIDPVIKPRQMSLEEIDRAIIECYQSFYMGKLTQLMRIQDEFKRRYILSSMKLIMNSSFIVDKLGSLGRIPAQVESLIRMIEHTPEDKNEQTSSPMVTLATRTVSINAPFSDVFSFVSSTENWPAFINGLKEIRPISRKGERLTFQWRYSIMGIEITGRGEATIEPHEGRMTLQMHSLMPIRKEISFEAVGGRTLLTVTVGYKRPGKVLNFLFNRIRRVLNIMETSAVLQRIKALCEKESEVRRAENQ